jgi:hypothetical protein
MRAAFFIGNASIFAKWRLKNNRKEDIGHNPEAYNLCLLGIELYRAKPGFLIDQELPSPFSAFLSFSCVGSDTLVTPWDKI